MGCSSLQGEVPAKEIGGPAYNVCPGAPVADVRSCRVERVKTLHPPFSVNLGKTVQHRKTQKKKEDDPPSKHGKQLAFGFWASNKVVGGVKMTTETSLTLGLRVGTTRALSAAPGSIFSGSTICRFVYT